jgi:alanyl-tRNA synthetase
MAAGAVIPAVRKAGLNESLQALTRRVLEEQKKAAAANKERAVAAAVGAADATAAAGGKFLVTRLDVGLDAKAVQVRRDTIGSFSFARKLLCGHTAV